jgi:hypothetical protein
MGQRRLNTFGALIDTEDMPSLAARLISAGRLDGNDFLVAASDLLQITAGSCMLPDGVLVIETEVKNLVIPNSSLAADYTILYQLEDTGTLGGSPAILRLLSGIKRQENVTDGTILGWVRYPGGNVALSSSFFIQPSHLKIKNNPAEFYYKSLCPLAEAIREPSGSLSTYRHTLPDMTITTVTPISFGSLSSRISGVTIMPRTQITESVTNHLSIAIKKGTEILFSFNTQPVLSGGNGSLEVKPTLMIKSSATPSAFIINPEEYVTLEITRTGIVPATAGEFVLTLESPATTGQWVESTTYIASEACTRLENNSAIPAVYSIRFPFIIADKQPSKLISRLLVDFNCLVTFSLHVKGLSLSLSPNNGLVSNTGDIITREFYVPKNNSIEWDVGTTAYVEMNIDAQAGRGVSIAYMGLTLEPTPFTLFIIKESITWLNHYKLKLGYLRHFLLTSSICCVLLRV